MVCPEEQKENLNETKTLKNNCLQHQKTIVHDKNRPENCLPAGNAYWRTN